MSDPKLVASGLADRIGAVNQRSRPVRLYEARMAHVARLEFAEMMASEGALTPRSRHLHRRWMRAFRKAEATGLPFSIHSVGEEVVIAMKAEASIHVDRMAEISGITIYPPDAPSPTAGIPYRPSTVASLWGNS